MRLYVNAAQRATDSCRLSALQWTTRKRGKGPKQRVLFLSCLADGHGRNATQAPRVAKTTYAMLLPDPIAVPPTLNLLHFPLSSFPIKSGEGASTFYVTEATRLPTPIGCVQLPGSSPMLAPSQGPVDSPTESLALYSQSLRDYTLRLWVESRRQAEERVHGHRKKSHGTAKLPLPTSIRKPSSDGNSSSGTSNDSPMLPADGPHT